MRSLLTYRSFAPFSIVVITAALLAPVCNRHVASIAAQGSPAAVASPSGMAPPGDGNAEDMRNSDSGAPTADSPLSESDQPVKARVSEAFGKLPLSFEANDGQVDRRVKFLSRGRGYNLFLTSSEAVLSLSKSAKQSRDQMAAASRKTAKSYPVRERAVVRMKLAGGNPSPQVQGLDELPAKTNYFIGADPSKWRSVSNYSKVEYKNVYPGIDLVYYGNQRQLEYDFVIAPGADPGAIKLAFAGAQRLRIDGGGDLALRTVGGELRMRKPVVYQEVNGQRKTIEGSYAIRNPRVPIRNRTVGFEVADYDPSKPLVIDPVLVYSTYIGGGGSDTGEDIAIDSAGNAYITGTTYSGDYPMVNAYQTVRQGNFDAFVTKINPTGNVLLYSTYLAGSDGGLTVGRGIAVDASGHAYVTGETGSANFPTKNAYQLNQPDTDVFVAKLDTNASGVASLLYSTYLGGNSIETGEGIAADSSGNAYVTGSTNSSNFPTLNAFQGFQSREDVFVTKLNTNASGAASLLYSTYIGGVNEDLTTTAGFEHGYAIAADSSGNVYVTGSTTSNNFPTKNAYQSNHFAHDDVFVTKLNTNASGAASLFYSTYLSGYHYLLFGNGQGGVEVGYGIAADASGIAYVTGYTTSFNFPTKNAYQATHRTPEAPDVFVTKLDTNSCGANSLLYSTFLGGSSPNNNSEFGYGIAADSLGNAYVTGFTYSSDFPTKNSLQAHQGGSCGVDPCADVFVTKLNTNVAGAAGLVYSTLIGGSLDDRGRGIAIDSSGNAYVTGGTSSSNFPANNPDPDTDFAFSDADLFVLKLSDPASALPPDADGDGVADASDTCPGTPTGTTVDANGCPVSCVAPPTGLVSWWPGEGSAIDIIDNNSTSLLGGTTFSAAKVGKGFTFDSDDDRVTIPHNNNLNINSTGFTVEFWMNGIKNQPQAIFTLVEKSHGFIDSTGWFIHGTSSTGTVGFGVGAGPPGFFNFPGVGGTADVLDGNFHHIAGTWDGANIRLYVDGVLQGTTPFITPFNNTRALNIGFAAGGGTPQRFFRGTVDEPSIYSRALSASEIQAIFNATGAGKCKPPGIQLIGNGTFLHTVNDNPAPPAIVDLAASGFAPGDVLSLSFTTQNFSFVSCNGPFVGPAQVGVNAVFSNSGTLLCPGELARVPGAIDIGPNYISPPTGIGSETTDIPQDFLLSLTIQVPVGATHLFLGVVDSYYGDNCGKVIVTIQRVGADLEVTKSGSPNPAPTGSDLTYQLLVRNNGPSAATSVTVTDNLPATTTFVSCAATGGGVCGGSGANRTVTFTSLASGASATVTLVATVNCPTPNGAVISNTATVSSATGDFITDNNSATTTTTASNPPPQITPPANASYQCLSEVPPGNPSQATATDNCGAPTITVSEASNGGAGSTASPLVITRVFTATDTAGNSASAYQTITVIDNTPPTITAPPAVNVSTGAGATACGTVVSDAALGAATASDNCGSVTVTRSGAPAGNLFPVGTTTITYTANDGQGNTATATQTVTVTDNIAPVIACPADITVAGNIFGSCAANVSVGTATATDNCGAPTITGARSDGQALNAPYPQGATTITWRATDAAGNTSTCQQTVTGANPAPVATITGPPTGSVYAVGAPVAFTGSFADNAGGAHTATWTFDSLTSAGTVNEMTGAITGGFTFTAAGVYAVKLTVNDGCGGTHTTDLVEPDALIALVVIYDPSAGWVTGGGWINSPVGAYVPNPSLTGKANFGFVSKYQNGATVPTGNTEFHFKAGDLKFKSTSYEWMVIAGKQAQYKGFGAINGSGSYRFMLTAIDGDQPGGDGVDKFRIRIWSDGGGLVYDNQMNDPDSNDPTTVLGGGSIVIHK